MKFKLVFGLVTAIAIAVGAGMFSAVGATDEVCSDAEAAAHAATPEVDEGGQIRYPVVASREIVEPRTNPDGSYVVDSNGDVVVDRRVVKVCSWGYRTPSTTTTAAPTTTTTVAPSTTTTAAPSTTTTVVPVTTVAPTTTVVPVTTVAPTTTVVPVTVPSTEVPIVTSTTVAPEPQVSVQEVQPLPELEVEVPEITFTQDGPGCRCDDLLATRPVADGSIIAAEFDVKETPGCLGCSWNLFETFRFVMSRWCLLVLFAISAIVSFSFGRMSGRNRERNNR